MAASQSEHTNTPTVPGETWVSVVMPVYNGERYVAQAIESILAQTHQHFEFVIVNDGSTDRTAAILDEYAARDPRIRVYHQENIDQPATLNRALRLARYDWVAIIDHDDVSLPHRLECQLQALRANPKVRLLGSFAINIDANGARLGTRGIQGVTSEDEFHDVRERNDWIRLIHPSVLFHRPTILAVGGYDPAFGPSADTELWSRVADEHLVLVVPEPLVHYRIHSGSMSANRFFEQRFNLRWIRARQIARRQGLRPPSRDEFARGERGRLWTRGWYRRHREFVRYLRYHRLIAERERRPYRRFALGIAMVATNPTKYLPRSLRRAVNRGTIPNESNAQND